MRTAVSVFAALLVTRASGFWGFLLRDPSSVDGTALRLWVTHGAWPLALAGGLAAVALGLGRRARGALGVPERDFGDGAASVALGLALLGQAVFLLGWAGALRPAVLAALTAAAAVLSAGALTRPAGRRPLLGPVEGACAGILAFAAACALADALAPAALWDARAYHLVLPELALRDGAFLPRPWLLHSHWPHLMEALYALPLAAGRESAAALLHLATAALLVGAVFAAGRKTAGPAAAWTAALLLAAQPAFLKEAGTAHSDAAAALLAFAAAAALARGEDEPGPGAAAFAGLLAGAAAAAKLTLVGPLAAWTLALAWKRRPRDAAAFAGAAALVLGPWLVKTWLATGDPAWPFLSAWTGDAAGAALAARNALSNRWGAFPPPAWALTADGPGFLLLPCAGLLALGAGRAPASPVERWLRVAAVPLAALALPQHAAWRYLMPVWPALALAAGRAAAAALAAGPARRSSAAALVAAGIVPLLALSPNNALFAVAAPRPTSAPDADRRALWEDRALDGLPGFYREARAALPPDARVLLFREVRGYGAGFDYLWGDPMNQALIDYRALPDPDALYARLRALGVTHVLDHPASALYREDPGYYDRRTLALMAECLRRRATVVTARDGFVLHRLL